MAPTFDKPIAIIQGVGPGTGSCIARKFAEKYPVILLSRTPANYEGIASEIEKAGGQALGIPTDVSDEASIKATFDKIKTLGPNGTQPKVAAAVLNGAGSFVRKPFLELTTDEFLNGYEACGRSAFFFSQLTLPLLLDSVPTDTSSKESYPPTLIFTGATASVKGSARFASFATGKWAVRALAQSLGREFGPRGVHVGHAVIDGVIDIPRTQSYQFEHEDAKISPHAIADAYWHLHTQPRTSFTFEIDMRPYIEKW